MRRNRGKNDPYGQLLASFLTWTETECDALSFLFKKISKMLKIVLKIKSKPRSSYSACFFGFYLKFVYVSTHIRSESARKRTFFLFIYTNQNQSCPLFLFLLHQQFIGLFLFIHFCRLFMSQFSIDLSSELKKDQIKQQKLIFLLFFERKKTFLPTIL